MTKRYVKTISLFLCAIIFVFTLSSCADTNKTEETETTLASSPATVDEASVQPTVSQTTQLSLEEKEYPTIKLDSDIDGESLLYEFLRVIDNDKYAGGSLIYINDDDVPELYIKSQSTDKSDMICYITEDGLSVSSMNISDSEGFWYLEKHFKILVNDVNTDQFTDSDDSETPTELHNGIRRDARLYYFSGNELHYVYDLGRYVVDGYNYNNGEKDDGGYDYYDGEKDIPVFDVFEAVKGYFDVDKAKTPEVVPISDLVEQVKGKRKNPDMKAGEYYGDTYSLVSTYKEVSTSIDYYDETKTLSYRIPQINLD